MSDAKISKLSNTVLFNFTLTDLWLSYEKVSQAERR